MQRIVLGYSGDLDTLASIPWLSEKYRVEVVAVTVDLGQGADLEGMRDRALAAGAARAHVLDARDEFARGYVLPALKADALDAERHPMSAALGEALVAAKLVDLAAIEHADAIAHGCPSPPDGPARLEIAIRSLDAAIAIVSPGREWAMTRPERLELLRARGIAFTAAMEPPYLTHRTLWGRVVGTGALDGPSLEPAGDAYVLTKAPVDCPDEAASVEITFDRGVPTAVNGVAMPLVELIASLGTIAGAHGVGRVDVVDKQGAGIRSRRICEAPAAVILHAAHRELQQLVTTGDADRFSRLVSIQYSDLLAHGLWFTPLREALDAFVESIQRRVTGVVRLDLFKGSCHVVGRRSSFGVAGSAERAAAGEFVKIAGLSGEPAAAECDSTTDPR